MIILAVMIPVSVVIAWYARQLYEIQLTSALAVERQSNELLRNQIDSDVRRIKTLLRNKADPLSLLIESTSITQPLRQSNLKEINRLLQAIIKRNSEITTIMLIRPNTQVIAAIDYENKLSHQIYPPEKLQLLAQHWGFNINNKPPEVVIPSIGRDYVSAPIIHKHSSNKEQISEIVFRLAVPVSEPTIGILIAEINVDAFWNFRTSRVKTSSVDYMLDRRGTLLTNIENSKKLTGDLLTHLEIVRRALIHGQWPNDKIYTGVLGKQVFGTLTEVASTNWTLISEVNASSITQPIWQSLFNIISFTLLGIIGFILMVVYLAGRTLKPLQATCDAIDRVAKGDLQLTLEPNAIKELNALSSGFNKMASARLAVEEELIDNQITLANNEAKFRGVLESSIDGVLMVNHLGKITLANQALSQLTGYSIEELIGETIEKLVPVKFNEHHKLRESFFNNPRTRRMGSGEILYAKRKNGTHFPVEVSLTPVKTNRGIVVAAMIQDVTVKMKIEDEKESLLKSLEDKNAELELFTYTVSHDLKSPLVTISGFIGLLKKDIDAQDKERIQADFARISEATNTMQTMLNDLLELSRLGSKTNKHSLVTVNSLVRSALEMLTVKIKETNAKISVEKELPTVNVDQVRFIEVYLNLIENALKYKRDNVDPQLTIGTYIDEKIPHHIIYFVKDNGIGIDSCYHKKIFGLFERLDSNSQGTGIGLAIVKRIVETHGGKIWVESNPQGLGITMKFTIPQKQFNLSDEQKENKWQKKSPVASL